MFELIFLTGSLRGQRFRLNDARISIGSKKSNQIVVDDPSVAAHHAFLSRGNKGYSILIHESKPSVKVNGKPVDRMFLEHGDSIRLGNIEAQYFIKSDGAGSSQNNAIEKSSARQSAVGHARPRKNWKGFVFGIFLLAGLLTGSLWLLQKFSRKVALPTEERKAVSNQEGVLPPEFAPDPLPDDYPDEGANDLAKMSRGVGPSGLIAGAKIHRSSKFKSHQEAVEAAQPGDSVIFDSKDDKPIEVKKPLVDIQFISGSAKWELDADIVDCQFILHELPTFIQKSGRLEKSVFFHCAMKQTQLINVDTVSFYFDERSPLHPRDNGDKGKRPILQLSGYVKNVLIHKPFSGVAGADKRFDMNWEPSIRINATDPEGDGRGTYILSPVVMGQRAWTPHHIARGNRVTYAHLTADLAGWADPVLDISRGTDCVILCTSIGAETLTTSELYAAPPKKLKYADHEELGHDAPAPAYRGAVICIQGQRTRIVGHGDVRKPWSVGRKSTLPGLHYADGIVAADPSISQFATEHGGLSLNLAEPRSVCLMNPSKKGVEFLAYSPGADHTPRYSRHGPSLIQPTFLPLKDLRINAGNFDKVALQDMTGKSGDDIEKVLVKDGSVYLGPGTYEFKKTLTAGFIAGAGMTQTVLKWPAGVDCARRGCRGLINCTVTGGKFGFNSQAGQLKAGSPAPVFIRTCFKDQKEACVNLHSTQFQTWQDCEFSGAKIGFTHGKDAPPSAGKEGKGEKADKGTGSFIAVDNLNLCNCTFRNLTQRGIDLAPNTAATGHVGVHNCLFEDVGNSAIAINGGQTHLVQNCLLNRCGKGQPAVQINSTGAVALSHLKIQSETPSVPAIALRGNAVVSHCRFQGAAIALKCEGSLVADHTSSDGDVIAPKNSLLCECRFTNADLTNGVMLVDEGGMTDVTSNTLTSRLDRTPPPEVEKFKVRTVNKQHRLEWNAVTDPESGILQYIIYSGEREIARTPFTYEVTDDGHGPQVKSLIQLTFTDPNTHNTGYRVVAVNGAGITSDGFLTPRRWGPARGKYLNKDGNEIIWTRFVDVKGKITGIVNQNGSTIPLAQAGKAGSPNQIYFDLGELVAP